MAKQYGKWNIEKTLSEGGQGQIFLVSLENDENKKQYVLKRLKNKNRIGRFINEIRTGLELDHPNILKVIDYDYDADNPYLVTEYWELGTLANAPIHELPILTRLKIFRQICLGVAYAHEHNVIWTWSHKMSHIWEGESPHSLTYLCKRLSFPTI